MTELELLTQAAASAASNYPLIFDLAQIGFEAVRNAREQRALGEMEIERAERRYAPHAERIMVLTPSEAAQWRR